MLTRSRWTRSAFSMAGSALLMAVACSDGGNDGPVDPDLEPGSIRATVLLEGHAAQGVTLRLFADGAATAITTAGTASNGQASFSEFEPGSYDVEIVVPSDLALFPGETARRDVTVESEW